MTIEQIINEIDELKPNAYDAVQKIRWLNNLDSRIWNDVYRTHENKECLHFTPYDENTAQDTKLLVPEPYAYDIYYNYLAAQIDRVNGEMNKYNQSISFYNVAYGDFSKAYNRTHRPVRSHRFLF